MRKIKYLDFESVHSQLRNMVPELSSQDSLAEAIGCSKANISQRRKEGRFLVDWLGKIEQSTGVPLDVDKIIADSEPYLDKGKRFSKASAAKNYWFYDWHPSKSSDPQNPMHKYAEKFFSDRVAVNTKYLAQRGTKPEHTFLYTDVFGSMAPRVLPTDLLLVECCTEVVEDGLYIVDKGGNLKVAEIKANDEEVSKEKETFLVSQLIPEYSEVKSRAGLNEILVGRVLLRISEQV
jgi:hypothetical protein